MRRILSSCLIVVSALVACGGSGESEFGNGKTNTNGADASSNGGGFDPGETTADGGTSDGSANGPACATAEASATREPVYLDIILDGSRSMDGHGSTSAGCDNDYSHGSASTCFVEGARELDPLAPQRSLKVCHAEGDAVDKCPNFKGLTGKKWLAVRGALLAFFDAAKAKADTRLGIGMYLFGSEVQKGANA